MSEPGSEETKGGGEQGGGGDPRRLTPPERREPTAEEIQDLDTARVVTQVQAGDRDAFAILYGRYFDRVYGYLRVALRDTHAAEDVAQQVFAEVLEALPRYERRDVPFRAWLFSIVRNRAIDHRRHSSRIEVTDPDELRERRDGEDPGDARLEILDWIADPDLLLFIERLPTSQCQVLTMRYMLGFQFEEIAPVLGRSAGDVRVLHMRGLRCLRARLGAIGKGPSSRARRIPTRRWVRHAQILRRRRFALLRR